MAWVYRTGCCCRQRDEGLTPRFENFVSGVFKIIRHTVHLPSFLLCLLMKIKSIHTKVLLTSSVIFFFGGGEGERMAILRSTKEYSERKAKCRLRRKLPSDNILAHARWHVVALLSLAIGQTLQEPLLLVTSYEDDILIFL